MAKEVKKLNKQTILLLLVIVFTLVLPLTLLSVGVFIFTKTSVVKKEVAEEPIAGEERLIPSYILNNKSKFNKQNIVIRGKIGLAPVVCKRKECPADDSCCGCPSERNLVIADARAVLTSKAKGRLRLLDTAGRPFCHRRQGSCEYDCPGWREGAIYDVNGVFFAEAPPPGWRLSLAYYFVVEGKSMVKRIGFEESIGNLFKNVVEIIKRYTTSGFYVLH